MRQLFSVCAIAVVLLAGGTRTAQAQPALADEDRPGISSIGAIVGAELDMADNFFLFGLDARMRGFRGLEAEPRFTFHPLNGGHYLQFDANALKNFELARPGRFRPLIGMGAAIRLETPYVGDSEAKIGWNLIWGTRIAMNREKGYEPFIIGQYTILHDHKDPFSLVFGASFRLGQ
jgi:hypothetical protein